MAQLEWRFCDKCFGMFFNGNLDSKGRCPVSGVHHAQGFNFSLPHDVPASAGQPGWRFCDKCFGMFFNGDPNNKGRCPAGGGHHPQGFKFSLPHDVPASAGQPGWRFCDKCFGMFFNGDPNNKGRCPAGGGHHPQGAFQFVLAHDASFANFGPRLRLADNVSEVNVVGENFTPNSRVTVAFQFEVPGLDGVQHHSTQEATASTTASGSFDTSFPVPENAFNIESRGVDVVTGQGASGVGLREQV